MIFKLKRKLLLKDILIISIICVSPFAFFIYTVIPKNLGFLKIAGFTIYAKEYHYMDYIFWVISYKMLVLVLMSVWFVTCSYKWRIIIMLPVLLEIYKLTGFLNDWYSIIENYNFLVSMPFSLIYFLFLYAIHKKIRLNIEGVALLENVNNELFITLKDAKLFNKNQRKTVKKQILKLRTQKDTLTKREYLAKLIALRDQLTLN